MEYQLSNKELSCSHRIDKESLCTLHSLIYNWKLSKFPNFSPYPKGYWDKLSSQRHFLDDLAHKLNITDQEGWFQVTGPMIKKHGGVGLLHKYKYSVSKVLSSVLPEYKKACTTFVYSIVQDQKLQRVEDIVNVPLEYHCVSHCVQFPIFDAFIFEIAYGNFKNEGIKNRKLNLVIHLWIHHTRYLQARGPNLMRQHDHSITRVLSTCFPELSLNIPRKTSVAYGYWKDIKNQRKFFDDLAKKLCIVEWT